MYLRDEYDSDPASYSEGTTLFQTKENVDPDKSILVEVIDFIRFIEETNQKIGVIKMDIEGAEVPLLEALLNSPALQKIEYIFVETHEFKIPEFYKRTIALRKRVEKLKKPRIDMNWG
jgi:FkbM family methyltransferase